MSRRQAVAARGYDLEALDEEIAADNARAASLGLNFAAPSSSPPQGITAMNFFDRLFAARPWSLTRRAPAVAASSWNRRERGPSTPCFRQALPSSGRTRAALSTRC